jgi:hypothetical protein
VVSSLFPWIWNLSNLNHHMIFFSFKLT